MSGHNKGCGNPRDSGLKSPACSARQSELVRGTERPRENRYGRGAANTLHLPSFQVQGIGKKNRITAKYAKGGDRFCHLNLFACLAYFAVKKPASMAGWHIGGTHRDREIGEPRENVLLDASRTNAPRSLCWPSAFGEVLVKIPPRLRPVCSPFLILNS
jgi:hypothetical protein